MKKNLFALMAIAAAFTSCSSDDILVETPQESNGKAIGFEVFTDKVTRATDAANSSDLSYFYKTFKVCGWKFIGSTPSTVFDNVVNEYFATDANGETIYKTAKPSSEWTVVAKSWYYEGVRYWDKMASSYLFSAYAPITAEVTCTNDKKITIGTSEEPITVDATNLQANPTNALIYTGFAKDYMLAQSEVKNQEVNLTFAHKLAKFNIKVEKSENTKTSQTVKITDIQIHNMKGQGYYDSSLTSGHVSNWVATDAEATYHLTTAYVLNGTTNVDKYYVMEQLMIPQSITKSSKVSDTSELDKACVYVKYKIGEEDYAGYYDLSTIFNGSESSKTSYTFAGGNQYTLKITVGPEPIHFTPSVTPWEDEVTGPLSAN